MNWAAYLFAKSPAGRNQQRRYLTDIFKAAVIALILGVALDNARSPSERILEPGPAIILLAAGLIVAISGWIVSGSVEPED